MDLVNLAPGVKQSIVMLKVKTRYARAVGAVGRGLNKTLTGFVVWNEDDKCVILSCGHEIPDGMSRMILDVDVTFSDGVPCKARVLVYDQKRDILLLGCRRQQFNMRLDFARAGDRVVRDFQRLWSYSHPCYLGWKGSVSEVMGECYVNGHKFPAQDRNLRYFDHGLAMTFGSSGAPLITENNQVIGMQAMELKFEYYFSRPTEDVIASILKSGQRPLPGNVRWADLTLCTADSRPVTINSAIHIDSIEENLKALFPNVAFDDNWTLNEFIWECCKGYKDDDFPI